jgi:hypothetical protein
MVVLGSIGSFVQLKYIAPEDEVSGDMMSKDFA